MNPTYGILGPTRALGPDGDELPLSGGRLRALVAALAVAGGRGVHVAGLAAEVWGEDDTPVAERTPAVQALVGRARRVLGRDAVLSGPGGYRLAVERDAVDLYRFERLAEEGASALRAGEPGRAATVLDEALGLWRGPVLADLPDRDADPRVVRAERRHVEARRDRLAAEVALGRAAEALAPLAALTAEHPLDEPLAVLRLRALRAAGRPAEALEAYEVVRTLLAERLGTDPGSELRALHAELLRPVVPPTEGAAGLPARLTTFVGRGAELDLIAGELTAHRLVTLTGAGGVGKTRLSLEAADRAGAAWPDGVRLVELAAVRDAAAVPAAVLTALGARETHLWAGSGAPETQGRDALTRLVEHCGRQRILVLLDNCEHVVDAVAALAETVLAHCPGVTILATSREPLGVPGEAVRPVEPLPEPTALRLFAERGASARPGFAVDDDPEAAAEICRRLDGLPLAIELAAARLRLLTPQQIADRLDDRFRLLTTGARTVLPRQQTLRAVVDWSWDLLTDPERSVLRRLSVFSGGCDLTAAEAVCTTPTPGGAPEAASDTAPDAPAKGAAAVPGIPRSAVAPVAPPASAALAEPATTVEPGASAEPATSDLRAATAATAESAVSAETDALPAPAGVGTPEPAESPVPTTPTTPTTLDLLGALVDKSLVVATSDPAAGGMRYRLLETVAEYGAERLDAAGERGVVEGRHLAYYRELVRTTDPELRGAGQGRGLARLEVEHGNVRAALRTAVARGAEQDGLCLVLGMGWFWQLREHQDDARTWSAAVCALGPDPFLPPVRPAPPLTGRPIDTPPPWPEEQLWEARRGVRMLQVAAQGGDGAASFEDAEARAHLAAVVDAYRPGLPQNRRQPGLMWYFARLMLGEYTSLGESLNALVDACEQGRDGGPGADWDLAFALLMRAKLLGGRGGDADRALGLFEAARDSWGIAESLSARGEAYERAGRLGDAAADYERAMAAAVELRAWSQVPVFKARLAGVRLRTAGDDAAAREAAEGALVQAAAEAERLGGEAVDAAGLLLIQHYGETGRTRLARKQLAVLEGRFTGDTPDLFTGMASGLHGWLDCLEGRTASALARLSRAMEQLETLAYLVAPHLVVGQFPTAAWAFASEGRAEDAARLLGAYDALGGDPGQVAFCPVTLATEAAIRARAESAIHAALPEARYASLHAQGTALTAREAAELVKTVPPPAAEARTVPPGEH
ncbi:BTAD domain-containing putative transcriptional regulator [Streptomyces sp. HUAS MG47]|uniref:ATP-binding protein n=1 Tax=Streptomyces solicamelliae TaxID=3231716 RepID=UPI003877D963